MNIDEENKQVKDHWNKICLSVTNKNWLESTSWKIKQISDLLNKSDLDNTSKKKLINGHIRKFTDKLGQQAWGYLDKGGQCAGAIYRTVAFMDLDISQRKGSKKLKTIHIEHTVPASVLAQKLIEIDRVGEEKINPEYILFYLLKYSVCTAMLDEQGKRGALIRVGFAASTDAFSPNSSGYDKPFMRYNKAFIDSNVIWDVWNKKIVDPEKFTFFDHLCTLGEIATECGVNDIANIIKNDGARYVSF